MVVKYPGGELLLLSTRRGMCVAWSRLSSHNGPLVLPAGDSMRSVSCEQAGGNTGPFTSDRRESFPSTIASESTCTRSLGGNWVLPVSFATSVSAQPSTHWQFATPGLRSIVPSLQSLEEIPYYRLSYVPWPAVTANLQPSMKTSFRWRKRQRGPVRTSTRTQCITVNGVAEPRLPTPHAAPSVAENGRNGFFPSIASVAKDEGVKCVCAVCHLNRYFNNRRTDRKGHRRARVSADRRWEVSGCRINSSSRIPPVP